MSVDDRLHAQLPSAVDDVRPDVEAELATLLLRAGKRHQVRRAAYAVGLVAAAVVAATTVVRVGDEPRGSADPATPSDVVQVLDASRGSAEDPAPLRAGRYAIPFIGADDDAPWGEVTVPDGWGQDRLLLTTGTDQDPRLRRIELVAVDRVARDPCAGVMESVGPMVADVVQAITQQRTVRPGAVRRVSIDGHTGQMVRIRVPLETKVERCWDGQSLRPFGIGAGWTSVFPGWTVRVWVLGVDGHRLVIMAAHGPETTPAEVAELSALVEDITIVAPR